MNEQQALQLAGAALMFRMTSSSGRQAWFISSSQRLIQQAHINKMAML
jgi:hypothetical protein